MTQRYILARTSIMRGRRQQLRVLAVFATPPHDQYLPEVVPIPWEALDIIADHSCQNSRSCGYRSRLQGYNFRNARSGNKSECWDDCDTHSLYIWREQKSLDLRAFSIFWIDSGRSPTEWVRFFCLRVCETPKSKFALSSSSSWVSISPSGVK